MKTTKKTKWKHFRHLTREEFDNPLLPLIQFCCDATSLDYYREDIHQFIRASCCHNIGFRPVDFGEMHYLYKRLSNHIELLYLLMNRYPDWELSATSPFYGYEMQGNLKTIHDEDMYHGTTMRFTALDNTEFINLHTFMHNFFQFKSLSKWRQTMDEMIDFVFSEDSFGQYYDDTHHIFAYLDKLGEAIFVAYEIRGKAYMLEHYADRFGIKKKKLVDAEANRADVNT